MSSRTSTLVHGPDEQRPRVLLSEQPPSRRQTRCRGIGCIRRSRGAHQHQWQPLTGSAGLHGQVLHHRCGRLIGPLQIVEDEHDRTDRACLEHSLHRSHQVGGRLALDVPVPSSGEAVGGRASRQVRQQLLAGEDGTATPSTPLAHAVCAPARRASSSSHRSSAVLPMPASPAATTTRGEPCIASANHRRSASRSSRRPTNDAGSDRAASRDSGSRHRGATRSNAPIDRSQAGTPAQRSSIDTVNGALTALPDT